MNKIKIQLTLDIKHKRKVEHIDHFIPQLIEPEK
jgi:hypothetical protein